MTGGLGLLSALKMITFGAGARLFLIGLSPSVKKPKVQALPKLWAITKGERLLTLGEEAEGVGCSPSVKKPMAITKGEKGRGVG